MVNSMSSLRVALGILMLATFFMRGSKRVNSSSNASACKATEKPDSWFQLVTDTDYADLKCF